MFVDKNGNTWYKTALHVHTNVSDGALSVEDAASRYAEAGFDVVAFTDHWKFGEEKRIGKLQILSGIEYNLGASDTSVNVIHIVGVGMSRAPYLTPDSTRQEVIDAINGEGGIAILAHPAWSLNSAEEIEKLHGFSALEIYNTVSDVGQSNRPYSGYITDILANKGYVLPLVATDDTHYYQGKDDCVSYIMVNANSPSSRDILEAIREERFYATQGPELYVRREGDRIIAEFSECCRVCFMSNTAWAPDRIAAGSNLTRAEYKIKGFEKWVRVEVTDSCGKLAWSNIIKVN